VRAPLVIAHRGASAGRPGNTLDAFAGAIEAGADMLEFDVRRTRDGALVVQHDALVHGVPVGRLTREAIGRRTGRTPPLLDEVLELAAGRIRLNVELKETGYVDEVVGALDGRVPDGDLLVTSFHAAVVHEVKRLAPHVRAGLVLGVSNFGSVAPIARALRCEADTVLMRRRFAERVVLRRMHAAGLGPLVWTINDVKGLRRHLLDPNVAGVITDVPDRALAVRTELGLAAPTPPRARPSRGTGASTRVRGRCAGGAGPARRCGRRRARRSGRPGGSSRAGGR
jgi:glycerophosphoryl diester phosphodiesterase